MNQSQCMIRLVKSFAHCSSLRSILLRLSFLRTHKESYMLSTFIDLSWHEVFRSFCLECFCRSGSRQPSAWFKWATRTPRQRCSSGRIDFTLWNPAFLRIQKEQKLKSSHISWWRAKTLVQCKIIKQNFNQQRLTSDLILWLPIAQGTPTNFQVFTR